MLTRLKLKRGEGNLVGAGVGNIVIDGKGGSRGRDRQRTTVEAKGKTAGLYREHEKNRGRVYLQR